MNRKSLSDLMSESKASGGRSRAARLKEICLAPELLAEVQRLQGKRSDAFMASAQAARAADGDGNRPTLPRRLGERPEGVPPEVAAIDEQIASLFEEMRDRSGELKIEASSPGEWRRWVQTHPARRDNAIDQRLAFGVCDADALANDLLIWVKAYNGEPVDAESLAYILDVAAPADVNDIVSIVVQLHEEGIAIPFLRSASLPDPTKRSATDSPETSESRTADSTAGSLPSDTSTTTPTEN